MSQPRRGRRLVEHSARRIRVFVFSLFLLACGSEPRLSPEGTGDAGRAGLGDPDERTTGGSGQSVAFRGPIILITLSGLRPDVVGALGGAPAAWTPNIDAFAGEADWIGTAVVASSAPAVALVSLMTGVSPWHHQVLTHTPTSPRPGIPLLAEVLGLAGYRTSARIPLEYDLDRFGLLEDFDDIAEIEPIDEATSVLSDLGESTPALYWFHLREANVSFERRDAELPRLASRVAGLPNRIQARMLLQYADPRLPLPAEERAVAWELFCHEVAWADQQAGRILAALRASGQWDNAWVVLTASQGMELGEHSQVLFAQNLGRESIEVPMVIKVPQIMGESLAVTDRERVSQLRLWATLIEGSGERPEPVRAPSLFRAVEPSIVSELYQRNGVNEFSLLEGDHQLLWTTRFAPSEPEYYYAQMASRGGRPPLSEPTRHILGRLQRAFENTLPLSGPEGGPPPRLRIERWTEAGVTRVEDRARAEALAVKLHRRWLRHVDRERTPKEESALSAPPG